MFLRLLKIFSVLILFVFITISCLIFRYIDNQRNLYRDVVCCIMSNKEFYNNPKDRCYTKTLAVVDSELLVYKVKYKGKDLSFETLFPGYIMPYEIARDTDAMIGYGVLENMTAEEKYSSLFNKPSYGFGCGIREYKTNSPLVHFESSCITTDKFLLNDEDYHQVSSGNIHTFGQKLDELNLKNKRIIVKMDIAGAEFDALPDILKHSDNVDAIMLHIHAEKNVAGAFKILRMLSKDYVLIARTDSIEKFTFVNKKLISNIYLPFKQQCIEKKAGSNSSEYKFTTISKIVVLNQKIENLKERILKR